MTIQLLIFVTDKTVDHLLGGHRRGVTPVPIPNTEVKPSTGDGTNGAVRWESSKLPRFFDKPRGQFDRGVFLCADLSLC